MMAVELAKENSYSRAFRDLIEQAPEDWLKNLRRTAFGRFTGSGFPTVGAEDWKYTNVAEIAKSDFAVATLRGLDGGHEELKKFNYERNGFTALNLAFADVSKAIFAANTKFEDPTYLGLSAAAGTAVFPHEIVVAEPGSEVVLIEAYQSEHRAFVNTAVQIFVGDNARVTHYRVQKESPETFHYGVSEITLGRGSVYNSTNINLGAALSRHDIELKFTAEGGEAWVDGLYMLNGSQHADTHSIIDHMVPNCTSHQTYKGVMNDKSRAVFNGKVFVRENAHGTDAQQSNKNLLLSNEARVDTKPQLEIFNDDVKCSHGATVGQLEEEELFYLLTRGLPENLARNLLTYGFAEEIINKIGVEAIKADLDESVLNRLNVKLEV